MIEHHHAVGSGPDLLGPVVAGSVSIAAALYLAAVRHAGRRGRAWSGRRSASWLLGLTLAGAAVVGPLAERAHSDFRAHMVGHLLLGMLAPLLLVLAAPGTLALRALPVPAARRLARLLRSRPVAVLCAPAVAAVLDVGGLWLLYRTDLYAWTLTSPTLHALVHLHVFLSGCLLTVALVGPDPAPHRATPVTRATVLVLAAAAHDVLAKTLYGHPPTGTTPDRAAAAAQIMYYGGTVVEIALMTLLCAQWWSAARSPTAAAPRR